MSSPQDDQNDALLQAVALSMNAIKLWEAHTAYVAVGFTDDQAFELVLTLFEHGLEQK